MDTYRINCAVTGPASCGLLGFGIAFCMKILGLKAVLTPILIAIFAWWPSDILYSGALVGAAFGILGATFAIMADISREAALREMFPHEQ